MGTFRIYGSITYHTCLKYVYLWYLFSITRNRYGDPEKKTRAKKANRLPPGTSYTVSAIPAEEVAGPSGVQSGAGGDGPGRGSGADSGEGRRGAHARGVKLSRANFYTSSSEDEDDGLRDRIDEIIAVDCLGAESGDDDSCEDETEDDETEDEETEGKETEGNEISEVEENDKEIQKSTVNAKEKKNTSSAQQEYEVGEFVVAVYEGQWLLAQVDINQDHAGSSHVNLAYMEKVGDNQFKWPKHNDHLLTLKEDILFRCSTPMLIGSSIRASNVGLPPSEALKADAALDLVVYLQLILAFGQLFAVFFPGFFTKISHLTQLLIIARNFNSTTKEQEQSKRGKWNISSTFHYGSRIAEDRLSFLYIRKNEKITISHSNPIL